MLLFFSGIQRLFEVALAIALHLRFVFIDTKDIADILLVELKCGILDEFPAGNTQHEKCKKYGDALPHIHKITFLQPYMAMIVLL